MDRKIKTRQVHKDIKVLDKTVTVTDHVKHSYVRTKETVMQSTEKSSDRENNPVGYAEDAASKYADRIFHETGHQVRRQAGKIIERKKEKASVSSAVEETVYQPKEQTRPVPPSGGEKALDRYRQSDNRSGGSIAGRKRRNNLLELVWLWKSGRVVCLLCVLVCRPERLYSEWSHSEIFSLFGRCEMV